MPEMTAKNKELWGLVLAGGLSRRMGRDKGEIIYHQKPQREHMADLLSQVCAKVFISCRPDQVDTLSTQYPFIVDSFLNIGPMGGLLSAMEAFPHHAWLLVACDMPLLNEATLRQLVESRSVSCGVTAFLNPIDDQPEPMTSIWESSTEDLLFSFYEQEEVSLRKIIRQIESNLVIAEDPTTLLNINTNEEWRRAIENKWRV